MQLDKLRAAFSMENFYISVVKKVRLNRFDCTYKVNVCDLSFVTTRNSSINYCASLTSPQDFSYSYKVINFQSYDNFIKTYQCKF